MFWQRMWLPFALVQKTKNKNNNKNKKQKKLSVATLKSFEIMELAEEISRQPSIDSVMWLLVVTLMQIYNDKEQAEQGKIQNVQIEKKRSNRCIKKLSPVLKEIKSLKKKKPVA